MSDSVWPHRRKPTRLPRPWDSLGKNTGVGRHFLLQCMKVKSESEIAQPCLTLSDLMDCSPPGSSIHGIFQAKYWSGVPLPSPGDLLDPGIKPMSLMSPALARGFFTTSDPWSPPNFYRCGFIFIYTLFENLELKKCLSSILEISQSLFLRILSFLHSLCSCPLTYLSGICETP